MCHGKIVSLFDTVKRGWLHFSMDGFVVSIFSELREDGANHNENEEDDFLSSEGEELNYLTGGVP